MNRHRQPDWNRSIREMFGSISSHYDLLNTLMTFGRDRFWRRSVIASAGIPPGGSLLDAGTGTGKIALEALHHDPHLSVVAADLTLEMMKKGRDSAGDTNIRWCCADALTLPFPDETFDAVTSGYLIRNVPDLTLCFSEQFRVVKSGGKVVSLDTSPPPDTVMKPLIMLYLKVIIPVLGGLITGKWDAYRYLPESTRSFKTPREISTVMEAVGFEDVRYTRYMFGTMAIIEGTRPRRPAS